MKCYRKVLDDYNSYRSKDWIERIMEIELLSEKDWKFIFKAIKIGILVMALIVWYFN